MLTLFRRHLKSCKHRSRRYKSCGCPIAAEGTLRGEMIRRTLDLRNWEAATRLIRDWEIHGHEVSLSVSDATKRWIADCEARKLKPQSIRKYKEVKKELDARFGSISARSISVDDLRKLRESWSFSGTTTAKRLELIRAFFSFCVSSGWLEKNPAKGIKGASAARESNGSL